MLAPPSLWKIQKFASFTFFITITSELLKHFDHGHDVSWAMVMWPPIKGMTHSPSNWTDNNKHVCKVCNWSRVVDCLMIVSWLSNDCLMAVLWLYYDCLMTQKEFIRIWWAMSQCRVGPCFYYTNKIKIRNILKKTYLEKMVKNVSKVSKLFNNKKTCVWGICQ